MSPEICFCFSILSNSLDNKWDGTLCSSLDSFRRLCPVVEQTADEFLEHYGDLYFISIFHKHSASSPDQITQPRKERKDPGAERYFQFITNILMIIEIYSKHIQNEFFDYIGTSRNLWKTLNMEDGRSIEEVNVSMLQIKHGHFLQSFSLFKSKKKLSSICKFTFDVFSSV